MKLLFVFMLGAALAIGAAGCSDISAPYIMQTDRVDQKMDLGNRGYLKGTPPPAADRGNLKRPLIAIDVDLPDMGVSSEKSENVK